MINDLKCGHVSRDSVTGTFAPKNFRSRERKYHGMELLLPGGKVPGTFPPGSESSWNFRSLERKFHAVVLSLPGAKVLRSESSCYLTVTVATSQ